MRTALFRDIMQRRVETLYRSFEETYQFLLRGSRNIGYLKPCKWSLYVASKLPYGIVILRCV